MELIASVDFYDYRVSVVGIGDAIEFQVFDINQGAQKLLHTSENGYGDTGIAMKAGIEYMENHSEGDG